MASSIKDAVEIHRLKELRKTAQALGFHDDVDHWTEELKKLGVKDS